MQDGRNIARMTAVFHCCVQGQWRPQANNFNKLLHKNKEMPEIPKSRRQYFWSILGHYIFGIMLFQGRNSCSKGDFPILLNFLDVQRQTKTSLRRPSMIIGTWMETSHLDRCDTPPHPTPPPLFPPLPSSLPLLSSPPSLPPHLPPNTNQPFCRSLGHGPIVRHVQSKIVRTSSSTDKEYRKTCWDHTQRLGHVQNETIICVKKCGQRCLTQQYLLLVEHIIILYENSERQKS